MIHPKKVRRIIVWFAVLTLALFVLTYVIYSIIVFEFKSPLALIKKGFRDYAMPLTAVAIYYIPIKLVLYWRTFGKTKSLII